MASDAYGSKKRKRQVSSIKGLTFTSSVNTDSCQGKKASNPWLQATIHQVYNPRLFVAAEWLFLVVAGFVWFLKKNISVKQTLLLYVKSLTVPQYNVS